MGRKGKEEQVGVRLGAAIQTRTFTVWAAPSWLRRGVTVQPRQVCELTGGALRASAGRPRLLGRYSPHTCG